VSVRCVEDTFECSTNWRSPFSISKQQTERRAERAEEFKAGVVRLVLDDGKTVGAVARDMDPTETAVREWVKRAHPCCD
jgi:transposase-like protein